MNKDWAEKNKRMQALIGKEASFPEGIEVLIELRNDLFGITAWATSTPGSCPTRTGSPGPSPGA